MRRTIVLVAVLLVSCTSSIAPSPTPATNTGVTSLAPSPTSSATIAAIVTAPPANASPTPIPLPSFADIAAAGSGVVWVLVADQHLFRSLDRGATWEERDVPQLPLGPMKNISFVDDRDGWLLTVGSPATGCMAQGFTVWRTTDGASTWERAHQATFSSSPLAGGCKSRVAFVDPQHGYIDVAGRDVPPAVLRTSDGGTTWTLSQRLPDPPGFVFEPSISTLQSGNVTRLVDLERRAAWRPAKGQIRSGGGPSERQKVPVAVDHHSRPLAARRSPVFPLDMTDCCYRVRLTISHCTAPDSRSGAPSRFPLAESQIDRYVLGCLTGGLRSVA